MNPKILLLGILAIVPAFQGLYAQDMFGNDKISISGSITQETGSNGATTILPITIGNVLSVLGISGTAKDMAYYSDKTTKAIVIAPKAAAISGSGTPIVTIGAPDNDEIKWNPTVHSKVGAATLSALNDDLAGSFYQTGVLSATSETETIKFVVFGKINGAPTIVKGTIVDISKK